MINQIHATVKENQLLIIEAKTQLFKLQTNIDNRFKTIKYIIGAVCFTTIIITLAVSVWILS